MTFDDLPRTQVIDFKMGFFTVVAGVGVAVGVDVGFGVGEAEGVGVGAGVVVGVGMGAGATAGSSATTANCCVARSGVEPLKIFTTYVPTARPVTLTVNVDGL